MNEEYLVETSIWIKRETETQPVRETIERVEQTSRFYVSRYIKMEFSRAMLLPFAEFYLLIHNQISTAESIRVVNKKYSFRPRRLKTFDGLLASLLDRNWIISNDVKMTKLQIRKYIRDLKRILKREMSRYIEDKTDCPLARIELHVTEDLSTQPDSFRQYIERFDRENKNPTCRLREFLVDHKATIERFVSPEVKNSQEYRRNKDFKNRWPDYEKLLAGRLSIKCFSSCARLGDTVISLELPGDKTLLTTDKAFASLCGIQGKTYKFLEEI